MTKNHEHIDPDQGITETIFESLFRLHYEMLCEHAFIFIRDNQTADDIVQEFFIKFWEKRDKLTIKGSFQSYARQAVRNSCINYINHDSFVERVFTQYRQTQEAETHSEDESLIEDTHKRLRKALLKLPKKCRKIFIMSNVAGLKYAEIAQVLNISINTVKTQIGIAYKIMRKELGSFL